MLSGSAIVQAWCIFRTNNIFETKLYSFAFRNYNILSDIGKDGPLSDGATTYVYFRRGHIYNMHLIKHQHNYVSCSGVHYRGSVYNTSVMITEPFWIKINENVVCNNWKQDKTVHPERGNAIATAKFEWKFVWTLLFFSLQSNQWRLNAPRAMVDIGKRLNVVWYQGDVKPKMDWLIPRSNGNERKVFQKYKFLFVV